MKNRNNENSLIDKDYENNLNVDDGDEEIVTPIVEQQEQSTSTCHRESNSSNIDFLIDNIFNYDNDIESINDFRLRREIAEKSNKISDIRTRKKNLLKDIDWAGISSSMINKPQSNAQFMSNDEYEDDAEQQQSVHDNNSRYREDNFTRSFSPDVSLNANQHHNTENDHEGKNKSSSVNGDIQSTQIDETADSLSPNWPNSTIATHSITVESLKWHKFLSSVNEREETKEETNANNNEDPSSSTTTMIEKNQMELTYDSTSPPKSTLPNDSYNDDIGGGDNSSIGHNSESIKSASNLAWNKFLNEQDNNETFSINNKENKKLQSDFYDDVYNEQQYLNSSSIKANYSPQLSPRRIIPTTTRTITTTSISDDDEREHREINSNNNNYYDAYISGIKIVQLSLELSFLKDDVRMLKEIINTTTTNEENNEIIGLSSNQQQQCKQPSKESTEIPTELTTNKTSSTVAVVTNNSQTPTNIKSFIQQSATTSYSLFNIKTPENQIRHNDLYPTTPTKPHNTMMYCSIDDDIFMDEF
ncbi:2143_t:CDS:2 [Ambispora gerdemannii]|uniref:2143_t:CDS:1 n=1 Tax=Ambispora gerdemannii TaxID=144530 RepID=A0A9N8VEQ6_9GLOM|nr:2143_t:CDS:2 [Ambispora gerdemannii]